MVTDRRTKKDWAQCIRELVDVSYPHASKVRLLLDNLNTHTAASTRRLHHRRRGVSWNGWSSITRPNMPVG